MFNFFQEAFDYVYEFFGGIFAGIESLIAVIKNVFSGFGTFLSLVSEILPFTTQVIGLLPGVLLPVVLVCSGVSIYKGVVHGA